MRHERFFSSTLSPMTAQSRIPQVLLAAYVIWFAVLAVRPYDRGVWIAENAPIVMIVTLLVATARWFVFSPAAYLLMSVLVFLHTLGGHYTFERVPFDWVTRTFGFSRNNFDRMAHFSVGFYAYAICELLERRSLVTARWVAAVFAVCCIGTVALGYEIFEWAYAVWADPAAGAAVLGSQGDPWDAQKDMLADTLGAIAAAAAYLVAARRLARTPAV